MGGPSGPMLSAPLAASR
ncbi:DUF6053 domain-containing protein [Lysobacter enzymogenes]